MNEITINGKTYILKEKDVSGQLDKKENSGDRNSGSWNSGGWNSGDRNSGGWNSGYRNSGYRNSGSWNSGGWNSGDRNSGSWNSGDCNSGSWNSGDCNSGDCNSGDRNSGYLNTNTPPVRIFNKETGIKLSDIDFPKFLSNILLTEWISIDNIKEDDLTDEIITCQGYLKTYEYKDAFKKSWSNANIEDRKKVLLLPNFNNEIFLEITGIDVAKELKLIIGE